MSLPRTRPAWPLALLTALLAACAGPEQAVTTHEPSEAVEPQAPRPVAPPVEAAAPAALPWDGTEALASNAKSYVIQYRPSIEPIPWGEPFRLDVWVLGNGADPALLEEVTLSVDAAMPEHGHGMNRVPLVTPGAEGGFEVAGLLLHMPGRWELYFDVTQGALTERAQVEIELE